MKEFNSVGVPSLKSALKEYFKSLIDKGIYEVDVTCINSEIMQVIENIPQLPAVPLDVHERMKREMNTEIENVKEKSIYFAKECQKARSETDRVTAIAAEWKDAAYKYADSIDKIKAEAIKEFMDSAIERVEKARQKYQRLCKEQGEEIDEAMNIHFNGMVNILKETAGEG